VKGSDTYKRFIGVRLLSKKAPSVSLYQLLLIYWIDADDGTIQLDPKSNSAKKNSSNFDVAPDDSLQEDVRSLSDRSLSWRSSPIEVSEYVSTEVRESREETPTPEADIMEAPQEDLFNSSKKKSKKSRILANRAIFEQECAAATATADVEFVDNRGCKGVARGSKVCTTKRIIQAPS